MNPLEICYPLVAARVGRASWWLAGRPQILFVLYFFPCPSSHVARTNMRSRILLWAQGLTSTLQFFWPWPWMHHCLLHSGVYHVCPLGGHFMKDASESFCPTGSQFLRIQNLFSLQHILRTAGDLAAFTRAPQICIALRERKTIGACLVPGFAWNFWGVGFAPDSCCQRDHRFITVLSANDCCGLGDWLSGGAVNWGARGQTKDWNGTVPDLEAG